MTSIQSDGSPPGGIRSTWGTRLRSAREEAGLSRRTLAGHLGVQELAVLRWESGERNILPPVQEDLARVLGRSITALFPRTADEADLVARCTGHGA